VQTTQLAASQQQERLVKRAKQANDRAAKLNTAPKPFVHQVHAPYVPGEAQYNKQRSFSRGNDNRAVDLDYAKKPNDWGTVTASAEVAVFRWADVNTAELSLKVGANRSECTATVMCSATELREIAARLLDAAYDLDAFPAAVLMQRAA
jgi:hypothetical protein